MGANMPVYLNVTTRILKHLGPSVSKYLRDPEWLYAGQFADMNARRHLISGSCARLKYILSMVRMLGILTGTLETIACSKSFIKG
jgi:hypothetical protein